MFFVTKIQVIFMNGIVIAVNAKYLDRKNLNTFKYLSWLTGKVIFLDILKAPLLYPVARERQGLFPPLKEMEDLVYFYFISNNASKYISNPRHFFHLPVFVSITISGILYLLSPLLPNFYFYVFQTV